MPLLWKPCCSPGDYSADPGRGDIVWAGCGSAEALISSMPGGQQYDHRCKRFGKVGVACMAVSSAEPCRILKSGAAVLEALRGRGGGAYGI